MMSLWDALRMNMMISYQELVRTFPNSLKIIQIKKRKEHRKIVLLCKNDEFSVFYKNMAFEIRSILETKLEQEFYNQLDLDDNLPS